MKGPRFKKVISKVSCLGSNLSEIHLINLCASKKRILVQDVVIRSLILLIRPLIALLAFNIGPTLYHQKSCVILLCISWDLVFLILQPFNKDERQSSSIWSKYFSLPLRLIFILLRIFKSTNAMLVGSNIVRLLLGPSLVSSQLGTCIILISLQVL